MGLPERAGRVAMPFQPVPQVHCHLLRCRLGQDTGVSCLPVTLHHPSVGQHPSPPGPQTPQVFSAPHIHPALRLL